MKKSRLTCIWPTDSLTEVPKKFNMEFSVFSINGVETLDIHIQRNRTLTINVKHKNYIVLK